MSMLTKILIPALLLSAGATAATAGPFEGVERKGAGPDRQFLVAQSDGPSLNEAIEQVRRQYNGRIVSAETRISGKREVHHIKVLTDDGKVKTVQIPGRTLRS
jgi:uncharacterized membrane protein YkoI